MPRLNKPHHAAPAGNAQGRPAIDLNSYVGTRIAILANRLSRAASRFYREHYGIGVVDWRIMMFVGHEKHTSANRICTETDLDKGAVSRSLNMLARMGLVSLKEDGADSRRRSVTLTAKGRALHDRIVPVALERQRDLLSALSPDEVEALMAMIDRMQARTAADSGPGEKPRRRSAATSDRSPPPAASTWAPPGR